MLFDRSWYNRAGVEKVMGFCTPDQTQDFLNAAPEFERHLVDDGMLLFKYWLCCDQEVQEERFENRLEQSDEALEAVADRYQGARSITTIIPRRASMMLAATHTDFAPWTLVDFNDQPLGRLTLLRDLLDRVPDTELPLAEIPWPALGARAAQGAITACCEPIPSYPVEKNARTQASAQA